MGKQIISTNDAPQAIGPYSQGVRLGNLLFASGQIPLDPQTGKLIEGDIEAQTKQVMENVRAILEAAGTSFDRVIKTTCYLTNLDDFSRFNAIYGQYFGENPPGRSTVQVARLPAGAVVEVECIAECD